MSNAFSECLLSTSQLLLLQHLFLTKQNMYTQIYHFIIQSLWKVINERQKERPINRGSKRNSVTVSWHLQLVTMLKTANSDMSRASTGLPKTRLVVSANTNARSTLHFERRGRIATETIFLSRPRRAQCSSTCVGLILEHGDE